MGLIHNILNRPSKAQIERLLDEIDKNNQLYRSLYSFQLDGIPIQRNMSMASYVKNSYESNPVVYSIVEKVATMLSRVPVGVYDDNDEVFDTELHQILLMPNNYQTWQEYIKLWEVFYMITGNGITYAPTLSAGNDRGKLLDGLFIVPTQHVEIESGGWRNPVKSYYLDINYRENIPASDIIHVRFPNMTYDDASNFMGMSPIKVAINKIKAMNSADAIMQKTFERGMPPGMLVKKNEEYDKERVVEHQTQLEKAWNRKHGKSTKAGLPVFGQGEFEWIKFGFDNFRDLQIIENSEHGLRELCNIWGVPSIVMNDVSGTTFNNQREARKAIYTNRIMPDLEMKLSYVNTRVSPAYGNLKIKAKWDEIEELQLTRAEKIDWVKQLADGGFISRNRGLEILGEEISDLAGMDKPLVAFNLIPIDQIGGDMPTDDEVNKGLDDAGIDDYKLRKVI